MDDSFFDAAKPMSLPFMAWEEPLFFYDPTVDREEWPFYTSFTPAQYMTGWLAENWEQTDATTVTVNLRQGVHYQNKAPAYGREFTADDVQYSWDRMLGTGNGFTEANPFYPSFVSNIKQVIATDKYTVQFKLKTSHPLAVYQVIGGCIFVYPPFTLREWMALSPEEQNDMNNACGTGAFMLTDIVHATSVTYSRNPDYWGYDMRYPENKLPYIDALKVLCIPDAATMLAAVRSAKIDMVLLGMSNPTLQQAKTLSETDPNIVIKWKPVTMGGGGVSFKWGAEPFDDIKVRQALQLAVDARQIAKTLSLGMGDDWEPSGLGSPLLGEDWVIPYAKWSADLKAQYDYNPTKAKELLAEAGYPNGFKTNVITSDATSEALQAIKSYFMDVGVDMEIKAMDRPTYQRFRMERQQDQMDAGGGGGSGAGLPSLSNLTFANAAMNTNGVNDPHYEDLAKQFDAATTLADVQRIFKEADQYYLEQHWAVQAGGSTVSAQVWQPWIKGYMGEVAQAEWTYPWYSFMWIDSSLKK